MNEELTPLRALKEIGNLKENGCYINTTVEYKIVETALKRLEQLEEEKQSFDREIEKKLKALKIIKELFIFQPEMACPFTWRKLITTREKIDLLKEELK